MNQVVERTSQDERKMVPELRGLPLLGSMLEFQKDPLGYMLKAAQSGPVVKWSIANVTFYQINHPDGIKHVLQDNPRNYVKGRMFDAVREVADGLLTLEGQEWLAQRRMMQPIFHRQYISKFGPVISEATLRMVERWRGWAESGQEIELTWEITHLTMEIVTRALFGSDLGDDDQNAIGQAITSVLDYVTFREDVPFYPSLKVPTPRNLKTRAALRTIDRIIYRIIQNRHRVPLGQTEESGDLLALLMQAQGEEGRPGLTVSQLRDEVLTFFIAGHETTAVLLSWALYLLGKHPDVVGRLNAEIEGSLDGRTPTAEDTPHQPYTRMVLEETLRLYPPAWITSRDTVQEDEICGCRIPANAVVMLSPYVLHHHPGFWEEPEKFDPERFSAEQVAGRPHFLHFPFGGGPRQCIGSGFAMLEASLVLVTLLQHFRFELAEGQVAAMKPSVTLRPRNGIRGRVVLL